MKRTTIFLTPDRAQYLAGVIAVGNDEDSTGEDYDVVQRIEDSLRQCPDGATITIESARA